MSFPAFRFKDLVNQNWNDSDLKVELESTKYMFFILEKQIMIIYLMVLNYGICQNLY